MSNEQEKRRNRPVRDKFDYRVGSYAGFLHRMEALTRRPQLTVGRENIPNPLKNLDLHSDNNMAAALFKAWAVVGDILNFYRERIADEGYLRTAAERKSILELTGAIGYILKPGLAASSYLAFTLQDTPDSPQKVTIPAGTGVQGMPESDQDQLPLTFETDSAIEARVQWNAMKPYVAVKAGALEFDPKKPALRLDGVATGVEPGRYLLITGAGGETYFCAVKEAQLSRDGGYSDVILENTAPVTDSQTALTEYQVFMFRQRCALFGYNAPGWDSLSDREKLQYGGTPIGGLFYYFKETGDSWNFAGKDLTDKKILALAVDETGNIYAGTEKGIFRSTDKGASWDDIGAGLIMQDIHALYLDSKSYLYAGTSGGGVYRSTDGGDSWEYLQGALTTEAGDGNDSTQWKLTDNRLPNTVIRAIIDYTDANGSFLFAGTDTGVYRYTFDSNKWEATGAVGGKVNTLAIITKEDGSFCLFAGTDTGVFRYTLETNKWEAVGMTGMKVNTLAIATKEDGSFCLFAAADKGVFLSEDTGNSWLPVGALSQVRSLALSKSPDATKESFILLAGTGQGVFYSEDLGQNWKDYNTGLSNTDIRVLAVNSAGLAAAAAPFLGVDEKQWPGFCIRDSQVDLVDAAPGIVTGSRLVLKQDGTAPSVFSSAAESVSDVTRTDFSLTQPVTRLGVQSSADLGKFDLREARVFAQAENVPLFIENAPDSTPVQGKTIKLAGSVEGLKAGQLIAISGQLAGSDGAGTGQSEVAFIESFAVDEKGQYTQLALQDDLKNQYDPGAVVICANVVPASHGETVKNEILGAGNAAVANQEFILKKPPLTYVSSPEGEGAADTLDIWVTSGPPYGYLNETGADKQQILKRMEWSETDTFYNSGPVDRQYTVRIDEENQAHVIFGDGKKGARLPTGTDNIVATYRSGIGPQGNLGAGTLDKLKDLVPGVKSVTNPVPASGGTSPDSNGNARARAPLSVSTLDRIVSLSDYENFALTFAGIAKARVKQLRSGGNTLAHITVAATDGVPIDENSTLYRNLVSAIDANRDIPAPYIIQSYDPLYLHLTAVVIVDPGLDPNPLKKQIEEILSDAFSFEKRELAQDVSASEIIALIQQIDGVTAVLLEQLYINPLPSNSTEVFNEVLRAKEAYWDPQTGDIHPAQLLWFDPQKGNIILQMEQER